MVAIWFPGLTIPEVKIPAGFLLDVWLLGVHFKIPPDDIVVFPEVTIWSGFKIFDSDWVVNPIVAAIDGVAKAVWDLFESTLDAMAEDYYERHSEEEE